MVEMLDSVILALMKIAPMKLAYFKLNFFIQWENLFLNLYFQDYSHGDLDKRNYVFLYHA